jgi:hypothetical protein
MTSYDSTNRHKTIRELHPDHCNALDHAKLSSKEEKSHTLHYMKQCIDLTYSSNELKKQKDAARNRGVLLLHRLCYLLGKANPPNSQGPETETQATCNGYYESHSSGI